IAIEPAAARRLRRNRPRGSGRSPCRCDARRSQQAVNHSTRQPLFSSQTGETNMGSEVVIVPSVFGTIAFIVWTVVNGWLRRQHGKSIMKLNTWLVERMGSVKAFSDFLQTDGVAKFFDSLAVERGSIGAHERILRGAAI